MITDHPHTLWLDLYRGAAGLQGPFLAETHVYDGLHQEENRIVMLVRGEFPASFMGGLCRGDYVHLLPIGSSTILAECALHRQKNMAKMKGGPPSPRSTLHPLKADSLASIAEVTSRLYPLVIAPVCAAVVFSEAEFGGLDAIIQLLVCWVRHTTACGGRTLRFRPSVIIYRHKLARLPGDLENRMTAEVLATCNHTREMTSRQAEATWRACFGDIKALLSTLENEEGVCREAIAVSKGSGSCPPAVPRQQLISILRYACVQFSRDYVRPVNFIQGSRTFKITNELARQLGAIFEGTAGNAIVQPISFLVAAAFATDSCRAGISAFRPGDIFDETYWPFLCGLKRLPSWHAFATSVRGSFIQLMQGLRDKEPVDVSQALANVRSSLLAKISRSLLERLCGEGVCLSCLAHKPHIILPCSHRQCDYCVQQDDRANKCRLCATQHSATIRTKPRTAGIRVLRLTGTEADAPGIGRFLQTLRAQVRCPLWENFDLVITSGVGIFFAIMIFCKEASIEECIYHVPRIRCVKQSRKGYKFGRRLQFCQDELQSNLVRLSLETDDSVTQAQIRWPGCKIDAIVEYHGGEFEEVQISQTAEKLQASLFYIELAEALPSFITPSSVEIVIRCRIPPGPDLANITRRLRSKNARVGYCGDEPIKQAELCPTTLWERIRAGHSFERRLHVHALSEDTLVNVDADSLIEGAARRKVSNCPCKLQDLVHPRLVRRARAMKDIVDTIGQMEQQLGQFLDQGEQHYV